jgi:hypothetical protein
MIGRRSSKAVEKAVELKGFDDFELRLGDTMRGERATMGKSLLDVQRELRIKAAYISAIENSDPDAFDTPGFIAGYVRSYARYLGMDADTAFETFCAESGFSVAHGMSAEASVVKKKTREERLAAKPVSDLFDRPNTPFVPRRDSIWSKIEPGALGSSAVLLALIAAIGFGGFSVLQEVQKVRIAPVEHSPVVLSDLDPVDGAFQAGLTDGDTPGLPVALDRPRADSMGRLYRPEALDYPVLIPRDAPIASLDPKLSGRDAAPAPAHIQDELAERIAASIAQAEPDLPLQPTATVPVVSAPAAPSLRMVAVRPSWVRVRAADGTVIFETIMEAGDHWDAPATEIPPTLRTGESGAIYFALNGEYYGPVGETGRVTKNVPLDIDVLQQRFAVADLSVDEALATTIVALQDVQFSPGE